MKITYYKMTDDGIQEMGDSEVMKRLIKKAKNGEPEVQYQLAKQYDYGKLTPRDFNKALFWYKTAAANNYEAAQFTP